MDNHDNWRRIYDIYKGLLSFLKKSLDIDCSPTPQGFIEDLKKYSLDEIRSIIEELKKVFQEDDGSEYIGRWKFWKYEYEDEYSRDEHFGRIMSYFSSTGDESILNLTQGIQAEVIDFLNEEVISTTGRNQLQIEERSEELKKLQERINDMKEHTP